jgi:hypothetical protein
LSVGVLAFIDGGTLPRLAMGGEVLVAWRPKALRLELAFTDWHEQSLSLAANPAVGGTFHVVGGAIRGCYEPSATRVSLAPCGALGFEHVNGEGYGDLTSRSGSAQWMEIAGGALGVWSIDDWAALRALVEVTSPLEHPAFVVEGTAVALRAAALSARGSIGFEVKIP